MTMRSERANWLNCLAFPSNQSIPSQAKGVCV